MIKTNLISCDDLARVISESGFSDVEFDLGNVSQKLLGDKLKDCCEAFGKEVFCFLRIIHDKNLPGDLERANTLRGDIEDFLEYGYDIICDRGYYPGAPVLEIPVEYFKAWHWNE